jgi:hypothetical protein
MRVYPCQGVWSRISGDHPDTWPSEQWIRLVTVDKQIPPEVIRRATTQRQDPGSRDEPEDSIKELDPLYYSVATIRE